MGARIGFDHYTIAHRGFTPEATLRFARAHRFEGVQFLDPSSIDESLDATAMAGLRRLADDLGLYLEAGLPSPNPVRRSRELGRPVTPAERGRASSSRTSRPSRRWAVGTLALYVGDRHDRFRTDAPWPDQVAATVSVIHELTPRLKDRGIRLAIETHADLTAGELLGHPRADRLRRRRRHARHRVIS